MRLARRRRSSWALRTKLPEDVHDHPAAVPSRELEVVHPVARVDTCGGGALEHVEDPDVLATVRHRRRLPAPVACAVDQRERAHAREGASPPGRVGGYDPLGELRVQCLLHSLSVAVVPPFDVIEGRLAYTGRICRRWSGLRWGDSCDGRNHHEHRAGAAQLLAPPAFITSTAPARRSQANVFMLLPRV